MSNMFWSSLDWLNFDYSLGAQNWKLSKIFAKLFKLEIWLKISAQMPMDFAFAIHPTFLLFAFVRKSSAKSEASIKKLTPVD